MTSKEALDRLYGGISDYAKQCNKELTNFEIEWLDTIYKDLEILEIIKKWSFIKNNYKEGYGTFTQFLCNIHTIGMKEDFEKVKEWLEK